MNLVELDLLRDDLKAQKSIYQPSSFWHKASEDIKKKILEVGVSQFRSIPETLSFFVPTYGYPGNSLSEDTGKHILDFFEKEYPLLKKPLKGLEQYLNGYSSALSDYRVLLASNDSSSYPDLTSFSESDFGNPIEHFEFDQKRFSRSSLNYLLGLSMLKKHVNEFPKIVLEIGGGFGTLGEILLKVGGKSVKYIDVDIPPVIFIAKEYIRNVFTDEKLYTYMDARECQEVDLNTLPRASFLSNWQIEQLKGQVDLFVNYISFQEMEPEIVENYFNNVKRLNAKWILLRNIREGKQLKTKVNPIGVETPLMTDDYISMLPEYELIDKNVMPFGYKTVDNFHSEILLFKRV